MKAAVEDALRRVGKSGVFEAFESVPEYSAVGESASNGKAERAIQSFEDLLRTLKSALEARIKGKLAVDHPVIKWLIEHTAHILTRYSVNQDGRTPYQTLHGKKSGERLVEFAEQVFYHVPKQLRAKLSQRWRIGTYLGLATSSNEHYVANKKGTVRKVRSVCRVFEQSRWSSEAIRSVVGTPSKLCPLGNEDISADIENSDQPHANLDDDQLAVDDAEADGEHVSEEIRLKRQVHITDRDLRVYGYTDGCSRCYDLSRKLKRTYKRNQHSDECRLRMYLA